MFCRRSLFLTLALLGISAAGVPANAVELVVVPMDLEREQVARLRELAGAWEQDTGNQLLWVARVSDNEGGENVATIADIYLLDYATAAKMARTRNIVLLTPPAEKFAPLYADMVLREPDGKWLGAPLADQLPVIHYDADLLARSGITEVPAATSWSEIFALAAAATDPVGEIHGFCTSGWQHATLLRSMLAEAEQDWLDPASGKPYTGKGWDLQADTYIKQLAQNSPPNAASLSAIELMALLERKRCALWLLPPGAVQDAPAMAMPGASAFLSVSLAVAAVSAASEQALPAADFARWLAKAAIEHLRTYPRAEPVIDAMLAQPGRSQQPPTGSWGQVDLAGQEALRKMVDGLVPVTDALSEAQATGSSQVQ